MRCDAYYRFGQTATPFRADEIEDTKLLACTGPLIYRITTKELQKEDWLSDAEILFHRVLCRTTGDTWHEQYRQGIVENRPRNEKIVELAFDHLAQGHKILIAVEWKEHAENLMAMLPECVYFIGGESAKKMLNKKLQFQGEYNLAVGTSVLKLGFDVPTVDVLIVASGMEYPGGTQQWLGRVLRPAAGKDKSIVHDFMDDDTSGTLLSHSKQRKETYELLGQKVIMERQ
jgi:superfamily II DNA or RNA helicase